MLTEEEAAKAAKAGDNMSIKDFGDREDLQASTVPKLSISSIEPEQ